MCIRDSNASAIAKPGIATGKTIVSSMNLDILPPIRANTYAVGMPIRSVANKHTTAIMIER